MTFRLQDRVVLVTGAAQGIGQAIASTLSVAGARVHLTDMDEAGMASAEAVPSRPRHVCDLSDRSAAHALVETVVGAEGRLDILALAAGGVRGQVGRPLEDIGVPDWRVLFESNVKGALWLAQAAAPHQRHRDPADPRDGVRAHAQSERRS